MFADHRAEVNYKKQLRAGFDAFLQAIGSDVFDERTLNRGEEDLFAAVGEATTPWLLGTLLWQHGLIGYIHSDEASDPDKEVWLYYHAAGGVEGSTAFGLPRAERYRLHACRVDTRIRCVSTGSTTVNSTDDGSAVSYDLWTWEDFKRQMAPA